jgi:hypothetical protein
MSSTTISYLMPLTKLRMTATVTTTVDTVLDNREQKRAVPLFSLVTVADPDRPRALRVDSGFWRDYAFTVGLAEDGRLTAAGLESTGQGGTVLAAAATLVAGAAAAVVTGNPVTAILAGVGAVGGGDVPLGGEAAVGPGASADDEAVLAGYREAYPAMADRLERLVGERVQVVEALDTVRGELREAAAEAGPRMVKQQEMSALKSVLAELDRQLDEARTHFTVWRESTITESTATVDELVRLSSLPAYQEGKLEFGDSEEAATVRGFFVATRHVMATVDYVETAAPGADERAPEAVLHVARARRVTLVQLEGTADESTVVAVDRPLIMDRDCEQVSVAVRRSWFARRRSDVTLSELGALTSLSYNGTSSASAAAHALSELPTRAAGGLEQLSKSLDTLDVLRARPQQQRIDALSRDYELEKQRLLNAGQAATAADYARLERLRQQKELAELGADTERPATR